MKKSPCQAYHNSLHRSYNKKVLNQNFDIGDLVLMENPKNQVEREKLGKFELNWLGHYIVIEAFGSGAY